MGAVVSFGRLRRFSVSASSSPVGFAPTLLVENILNTWWPGGREPRGSGSSDLGSWILDYASRVLFGFRISRFGYADYAGFLGCWAAVVSMNHSYVAFGELVGGHVWI